MTCISTPEFLPSDSSDAEDLPVFLSRSGRAVGTGSAGYDVLMVDSDSEEEPLIPLAVRLKQKQLGLVPEIKGSDGPPRLVEVPAACCSVPVDQDSRTTQSSSEYLHKDAPPAGDDGAYPAKRKKTPAEVEASRQEALKKRAARELQQKEKERLRLEKKALADAVKALKPEECIKHIVVTVDPGLLQLEGGGALLTSLHAMGCSCAIEKQSLPRSVTWTRRSPCPQSGEVTSVSESLTVVQVPVDNFLTMISNNCKQQSNGPSTETGASLTSWTRGLMSKNPGRTLSLVVIDIEKYFKSQNSKCQKKYREEVLGQAAGLQGETKKRRKKNDIKQLPEVSRVEVEEALVDLQLQTGVQVRFLPTWKDFTDFITMSTKAVAEAPFKRDRENTGFTFCLESEWSGGQKVDRTGNGLLQVWKRQIQQLNRVSPDMASAILGAYPSPQLLAQAYARCRSETEKMSLLSDLLIRRGEGVTSTTRRVGPELSKRLFLLMTSTDAQQPLDSVV